MLQGAVESFLNYSFDSLIYIHFKIFSLQIPKVSNDLFTTNAVAIVHLYCLPNPDFIGLYNEHWLTPAEAVGCISEKLQSP